MASRLRAAACHVSPVFLSARDTTAKCISLISRASTQGSANLVVFPESYIPAFPYWSSLRAPTENHELFARMAQESLYIDGPEMLAIRQAAKTAKAAVSVGISEKVRGSAATLFNANVLVGADGRILVHHRKLVPTFFEKLTWSPGDGHGLRVAATPQGRIGALICGENTNPLARYALMAQGEQVHISTWPAVWPTRVLGASKREGETAARGAAAPAAGAKKAAAANYDNVSANRTRAAAHCFEAKCFGILCSGVLDADAIKTVAADTVTSDAAQVTATLESSPRGATMFLDPTGALLEGFTIDSVSGKREARDFLQPEEGILYADLDLEDCVEGKQYHDTVGGYQRLDIFDLKVNRTRREPATFTEDYGQVLR
ncbi:hypothetical protein MBLNU459_g2858t1 [Dothideomycetes sp. NU459]